MKQTRQLFATTIAGVILFGAVAYAQTDSTKASGNWNSASTWKSNTVPTGTGTYIIRSTDSVYFNVPVTITGTIKSLSGKVGVFDSSKVVFDNGSTYEHAVNAGTIPKATWNQGSTCLITGATANAPNNSAQNFYNLTWDCVGQTTSLNLGLSNQVIGGNIHVKNTATSLALRLSAGNITIPGGRKLITINGNILVDSATAFFTASGSGSPDDTFSVVVKGNIISKGNFQLANGSGASVNWFVHGNILAEAGSFTTNSTATKPDSLFFSGTTKQTFTRGGAVTSSNIRFAVRSGAIVDFDTSTVGGSSTATFTLSPGATIISGRSNGLKGNLNNGGTTTLSAAANFEYDGTVAQVDTLLPATVNNLTINNAAGFKLLNAVTINGVLSLKAGQLDNTIPFTLGPGGTVSFLGGSLKVPLAVRDLNEMGMPKSFFVEQNYPNPFNPSTVISFGISEQAFVSVSVYNLVGQEIAPLYRGTANAGIHQVTFDASRFSSGVYLYRVQAGSSVDVKRMTLMK